MARTGSSSAVAQKAGQHDRGGPHAGRAVLLVRRGNEQHVADQWISREGLQRAKTGREAALHVEHATAGDEATRLQVSERLRVCPRPLEFSR